MNKIKDFIVEDTAAYYAMGDRSNPEVSDIVSSFLFILFFYIITMFLKLIFKKRIKVETANEFV